VSATVLGTMLGIQSVTALAKASANRWVTRLAMSSGTL
jgi:hypothetical protein